MVSVLLLLLTPANSLHSRYLNIQFPITRAAATLFGLPSDCSFNPATSSRHHVSTHAPFIGCYPNLLHSCTHYSLRQQFSRFSLMHRHPSPLTYYSCSTRFSLLFCPDQHFLLHSLFCPAPLHACLCFVCLAYPSSCAPVFVISVPDARFSRRV